MCSKKKKKKVKSDWSALAIEIGENVHCSEKVVANKYTSSLLEVILQDSGSAPPVPPRSKGTDASPALLLASSSDKNTGRIKD